MHGQPIATTTEKLDTYFQPQRVYIANFGRGNYLWPKCKELATVATLNDEDLHELWRVNDRAGFVDVCVATKKSARGIRPPPSLASRWFNLASIVSSTSGDLWIHRQQDELWWTISSASPATEELQPVDDRRHDGNRVWEIHKPARAWACVTLTGARLSWNALHARAKEFLFTEGTLQKLSDDNAEYAWALVQGGDLSAWHERPEWIAKQATKKHSKGEILGEKESAIALMVTRAMETARTANGQTVERTKKNKNFLFDSYSDACIYVSELWDLQEGLCAISGLPLQMPGSTLDRWMACSLDRIDSQGQYGPGNLQIVCWFVNRWKSDTEDQEFRRLFALVQGM